MAKSAPKIDPARLLGDLVLLRNSTIVGSPRATAFGIVVGHTCLTLALTEHRSARLLWAAPERLQERLLTELHFERDTGAFGRHVIGGRRGRVLLTAARALGTPPRKVIHELPDMRETFARDRVRTTLRPRSDELAERRMRELGLDPTRPFVTFHTRAYPPVDAGARYFLRGTRPATYADSVVRLAELGYQTIHVGREVESRALPVTVAVSPHDPQALRLQLWSIAHSRFFVASDSGPYQLSWLLGTPCLQTNLLNLLGLYPLRMADRCLPKLLVDRSTGERLGLDRLMTDEFWVLGSRKARLEQYDYVDNTAEEIVEAVEDMVADLADPRPPTAVQASYRERVESMLQSEGSRAKIAAKIGKADVYVGDGRISRRFAERHAATRTTAARGTTPSRDLHATEAWREALAAGERVTAATKELAAEQKKLAKLEQALNVGWSRRRLRRPRPSPLRAADEADPPIPRIVHHVALGAADEVLSTVRAAQWRRRHPTWDHRVWTESNLPHGLRRFEVYERFRSVETRTGLLRLELLRLFGGLSLDGTLVPTGPLEPALGDADFVASPDGAVLGAAWQHPLVERLLDDHPADDAAGGLAALLGAVPATLDTRALAERDPLQPHTAASELERALSDLAAGIAEARAAAGQIKGRLRKTRRD